MPAAKTETTKTSTKLKQKKATTVRKKYHDSVPIFSRHDEVFTGGQPLSRLIGGCHFWSGGHLVVWQLGDETSPLV